MSKRVTIVLPNDLPRFALTEGSIKSERSVKESALVRSSAQAKEPGSSSQVEEEDSCWRHDEVCCCCHCVHMRCALKRAAFLRTPEGQHRLEMKMLAKNMFMDICAMSHVRKKILNQLHGTKELHPSSKVSFPVSITNVEVLGPHSLTVEWFVHDTTDVDHYAIFVNNSLRKRVYSPKASSTVIVDVDVRVELKVKMKAVPRRGRGSRANPIDKLVHDVLCCGRIADVLNKDEYFCQCIKDIDPARAFYKKNNCKSMVDFWQESEFLYMPENVCTGPCSCESCD